MWRPNHVPEAFASIDITELAACVVPASFRTCKKIIETKIKPCIIQIPCVKNSSLVTQIMYFLRILEEGYKRAY